MLKTIVIGRVCYDVDMVMEKMPEPGTVNEFFEKKGHGGGSAANMAICLSKWGIGCSFAGILGNDFYGTRIRKEFEQARIDTRYIEQSYDNDTPISCVMINQSTKETTVFNLSDKYIGLKKCDFDFMPDIIVMDGYDVVEDKLVIDRYPKAISILDATITSSSVAELIKKVKYCVCSKEFAEALTGIKIDFQDPSTLIKVYQRLKKKHLKTEFVVTLGERGALYSINNQIKVSPSLKVDVKDTHGAGNVFRAAFAFQIAHGGDIEKAVKWGNIAAGLSCRAHGAREGIPTLEEIENIYNQNY